MSKVQMKSCAQQQCLSPVKPENCALVRACVFLCAHSSDRLTIRAQIFWTVCTCTLYNACVQTHSPGRSRGHHIISRTWVYNVATRSVFCGCFIRFCDGLARALRAYLSTVEVHYHVLLSFVVYGNQVLPDALRDTRDTRLQRLIPTPRPL